MGWGALHAFSLASDGIRLMTKTPSGAAIRRVRCTWPGAFLAACLSLALGGSGLAGQSIGLVVGPFSEGSPVVGASLSLPVAGASADAPVRLLARFDVTSATDFVTPPAIGFMPVVESALGAIVAYAGAGYSVAWEDVGGTSSSFGTWVLLAGSRVPVSGRIGVKAEVVGAPREEAFGMVFGIEVAPWR